MRAALLIAGKDLKARFRDRSALMLGIVVPLALAFIFNAIFGGISGGSGALKLGIVDADRGPAARVLVEQVLGSVQRAGFVTVHPEPSERRARELAAKGTLNAAIVVPPGFSAAVEGNRVASLRVIGNVDSPISTQIARSIAQGYASDLNGARLSVATVVAAAPGTHASTPPDRIRALAARAVAAATPVTLEDTSTSEKQLSGKTFYSAGMAVFFLFFTVSFGVTGLLEERNEGTLARLVAAPIARASILGAKLLTSFLLGLISMTVLVVATTLLFGATWGNPVGVAILVVAGVLAAMGVMALIATFARSAEQAGNWQSIVAVILGLLGGTFFPVSQAPGILSKLTFVAPQAWFLRGLGDLRAGSLSVVWVPTLAMLAFAAVTGAIASTRLRRMAEV